MARDNQYDLMFDLEDSGFQGIGGAGDNPISHLLNNPSSPGDFLKMNDDELYRGEQGILSMIFNSFKNPFSSLEDEGEYKEDSEDEEVRPLDLTGELWDEDGEISNVADNIIKSSNNQVHYPGIENVGPRDYRLEALKRFKDK
jgi:hypothetical protein